MIEGSLKARSFAQHCGLCFAAILTLISSGAFGQRSTGNAWPPPQQADSRSSHVSLLDPRAKAAANTSASVAIIEFVDFASPVSRSVDAELHKLLESHPANISLLVKHLPVASNPKSLLACQAALAAGEQGSYWNMRDVLLAHQDKTALGDLIGYARGLHLDVNRFRLDMQSRRVQKMMAEDHAMALALGVTEAPAVFVNGQSLSGAFAVAGLSPAVDRILTGSQIQSIANANHSPAELDISGSPVRGDRSAPVTIVEFSDFQCPFCSRVTPILQDLIRQYPGQVRWVFKNFPLDFHLDSPLAHSAALAAADQGRFWEMHDLIIANQRQMKRENLIKNAEELHLDLQKFTATMDSAEIRNRVEEDRKQGLALGINGTPTFFINGKRYTGALPLEQFRTIINNELRARGVPPEATGATQPTTPVAPEIAFGAPDSPVTLTWFSDLQSSLSPNATKLVHDLMEAHPGKIRLVFKNRPLDIHRDAILQHEAAMAAHAQGKFWEMHELILANQQKTTRADLVGFAARIGLDVQRFASDLDSGKYRAAILADMREAQARAVLGSPVFFLNSARVDGLQNQKLLNDIVLEQLDLLSR